VIDVNQDPLGLQASRIYGDDTYATYLKTLEDGSVAIAFFNLSETPKMIGIIPSRVGLLGRQVIRDLWRQKDIGEITDHNERWETEVAPHGVVFLKFSPGIEFVHHIGRVRS
jgi:alpha-galactosidase